MNKRSRGVIKGAEKRLRRTFRAATGRLLSKLTRRNHIPVLSLDPVEIHQLLVVRMNGRMGNTLFLTPLLTALHDLMPHAAMDVLVSYPDAPDLLRGLPGVRDVMTIQHKGWWRLGRSLATLQAFRTHRYDLAIDPTPNSFGGRFALMLARTRWRIGFGSDTQWVRLDFAAELPPGVEHFALRPLALLRQAFGYRDTPGQRRLTVANSVDELADGARLFEQRLRDAGRARNSAAGPVIAFFASARGNKDLGSDWWRDFWRTFLALRPGTIPVEILPTAGHPPVEPDFPTVQCSSPRQLAAAIAPADWFFSADTGPMHLVSAAGVPTVAFFDRTDPARHGPIKPNDTSLRIGGLTPQAVAAACAEIVATGH